MVINFFLIFYSLTCVNYLLSCFMRCYWLEYFYADLNLCSLSYISKFQVIFSYLDSFVEYDFITINFDKGSPSLERARQDVKKHSGI